MSHASADRPRGEWLTVLYTAAVFDVAFARVVLGALAGWLSHRQQEAIAYLTGENWVSTAVAGTATSADRR